MKRISVLLSAIAFAVVFSCQKPEKNDGPAPAEKPLLVSSVPSDGAEDLQGNSLEMTLTFDRNVLCPTAQQDRISVGNGAVIDDVSAYMTEVTVNISGLEEGRTYTVVFPEGTVTGYDNNPAEEIRISFSMKELVTVGDQNISENLVTADPIPQAKAVYDYLRSVYGSRTLSGAMSHVAWNTDEADWVGEKTGEYPAIAFFDYIHLASSPANWIDYGDISPVRDWWNAGGLVGAGWHWNVPRTSSETDPNNYTCDVADNTFSVSDALQPGTWENEFMNSSLEKIASYLKLLQDEGIPVIWRPLHEAAGNTYTQWHSGAWFWWGAEGAQAYKELWIHMFEYFREAGLRNLIWVWTTQTSSAADADFEFYPGDEYVDIIGRDVYDNTDAEDLASQYSAIIQYSPSKMVALSELGGVADMSAQWNAGARWLFFMPWYDYDNDYTEGYDHDHADIAWWKASFGSDAVIDRASLPSSLFE